MHIINPNKIRHFETIMRPRSCMPCVYVPPCSHALMHAPPRPCTHASPSTTSLLTRPLLSSEYGAISCVSRPVELGRSSKIEGPRSASTCKVPPPDREPPIGRGTSGPPPSACWLWPVWSLSSSGRGTNLSRCLAAGAGWPGAIEEGFLGRDTEGAPVEWRWPGPGLRFVVLAIAAPPTLRLADLLAKGGDCWSKVAGLMGADPKSDEPSSLVLPIRGA